jgi:hypothetical protein
VVAGDGLDLAAIRWSKRVNDLSSHRRFGQVSRCSARLRRAGRHRRRLGGLSPRPGSDISGTTEPGPAARW